MISIMSIKNLFIAWKSTKSYLKSWYAMRVRFNHIYCEHSSIFPLKHQDLKHKLDKLTLNTLWVAFENVI